MNLTHPALQRLTSETRRVAYSREPVAALRIASANLAFFVVYQRLDYATVATALISVAVQRGVPIERARSIVAGRVLAELN